MNFSFFDMLPLPKLPSTAWKSPSRLMVSTLEKARSRQARQKASPLSWSFYSRTAIPASTQEASQGSVERNILQAARLKKEKKRKSGEGIATPGCKMQGCSSAQQKEIPNQKNSSAAPCSKRHSSWVLRTQTSTQPPHTTKESPLRLLPPHSPPSDTGSSPTFLESYGKLGLRAPSSAKKEAAIWG